jgi:hypothetical protein
MKNMIAVIITVISIPIFSFANTIEVESFSTYEMATGKTLTYTSCKPTSNMAGIELAKELNKALNTNGDKSGSGTQAALFYDSRGIL